ncbi:cation-translocating P-type ATPase [Patescibacteria group bacterium]
MSVQKTKKTTWHLQASAEVAAHFSVDPSTGLSNAEVSEREQKYGPNSLTEKKTEPLWQAFLRQYKDYMRIVLLIAAIGSLVIGNLSTAIVLFIITVINAISGLSQERKAEKSVAALRQMMNFTAKVRRDGQVIETKVEELVPGDIVLFKAGDRVPADGRLLVAASLEIEESALTGESAPVEKSTKPIDQDDAPLGDRVNMAYMNSNVTRGRGEMIVTAIGMDTEVGHIADMLQKTKEEKSPLQKQVDGLTIFIAIMAAIALVVIILVGYSYGATFSELYVLGIALAIAAIPTALPIIVTMILGIGTRELAKRKAIVKKLPSVETLGSTSAICSDKTGTLTLNQMTARALIIAGKRYEVTGEGCKADGKISSVAGVGDVSLDPYVLPMALCSDAVIKDGELVGDPTEGALVALAAKEGIDIKAKRKELPRVAEVPFDSEYKLMATFHEMKNEEGQKVIRCYVKGAPDALITRASSVRDLKGQALPLNEEFKKKASQANDELAEQGMRILVVAERDFDPISFDPKADLLAEVKDLTLLAMIGIVDPPRPEAKKAIAECKAAGIRVRMITGDHAVTAGAIAAQLGIEGKAITGAEFAKMSDKEAKEQIKDIGVIARVAPEDKVKLVKILQETANVVAMTGDGVNDAPALKKADIGVAMGITGTDVSKEAAVMILTDDNFSTIVRSVEYGRTIYDNLLKYIRFQMAGLFSFILAFLGTAIFGVSLALFTPGQILFVNYFIQGPIGITFALDTPTKGLMKRKPRPANSKIMRWPLTIRLIIIGLITAIFSVAAYQWVKNTTGSDAIAQTIAMVMFSFCHIAFSLNLRHPRQTVFRKETLTNKYLFLAYGWIILAMFLLTEVGIFQRIFSTEPLTPLMWGICVGGGLFFLVAGEIARLILKLAKVGEAKH